MTGTEFEEYLCRVFQDRGFWALNIPKNRTGAQPFDVIALKGDFGFAVDCKVCSSDRFPLSRVEDNQWSAFELVGRKTCLNSGIMCFRGSAIYYIPYIMLDRARRAGAASIKLDNNYIFANYERVGSE